jgi:hypothetical protein
MNKNLPLDGILSQFHPPPTLTLPVINGKGEVRPEKAMKAQRGSRDTVLLFL